MAPTPFCSRQPTEPDGSLVRRAGPIAAAPAIGRGRQPPRHAAAAESRRTRAGGTRRRKWQVYQAPTFGIELHGSALGSDPPFCSSSTEIPSGERTKAMWPSRGGRLMVTPWSASRWQVA